VTALVLAPVLAITGVIWVVTSRGSAEETARAFLDAWAERDYATMKRLVHEPPADFDRQYRRFFDSLRITAASFEAGDARELPEGRAVPFQARLTGAVNWSYEGLLRLGTWDREWKISWSPAAIHPELGEGRSFKLVTRKPSLAPITAADGTRIDGADAPGSVQQLVGELKKTYAGRLTGTPATSVVLVDRAGKTIKTVASRRAASGRPLTTTLDLSVHRAAAAALETTDKPASLVALRPSTGELLAVVNNQGGFNRALLGKYPPGSTFKVITASALVADGVSPDQMVKCPARRNIGGFVFRNAGFRDYGTLPFRDAFAHSCNTTFGDMIVSRLGARRLAEVAADFGFNSPITPGVPAVRAEFPAPKDDTELASAAIGQGRVLASPLNMAAVAAAIADGTWRQPRLVPAELVPAGGASPRELEPAVVAALRQLMPAVVSEGTAHTTAFPSGTAGKTGTAEYGSGEEPPAHSWFIGYRGDLAFAVVVEGGGAGSEVAAPIAAKFLAGL